MHLIDKLRRKKVQRFKYWKKVLFFNEKWKQIILESTQKLFIEKKPILSKKLRIIPKILVGLSEHEALGKKM